METVDCSFVREGLEIGEDIAEFHFLEQKEILNVD